MLKGGSVLPNNTASARKANESSFVDRSPNERGEYDCLRIQALARTIQRGKCSTGYKEETREQRQKEMLEIASAAPTPYTWKALQSTAQCPTHTHREQACKHTVCLFPLILPQTHVALYRKGQIHGVHNAEGGSLVGNTACYISRLSYKVVVHNKRFYVQRQPENRSLHETLHSLHLGAAPITRSR